MQEIIFALNPSVLAVTEFIPPIRRAMIPEALSLNGNV